MRPVPWLLCALAATACSNTAPEAPTEPDLTPWLTNLGTVELGEEVEFELQAAPGLDIVNVTAININDNGVPAITQIGESDSLKFRYAPTEPGIYRATIEMVADDASTCARGSVLGLAEVRAQTVAPCIQVGPTFLDIGSVEPGSSSQRELTVRACGDHDVHISSVDISNLVFASPVAVPLTIEAGTTTSLPVVFSASSESPETAAITLRTNGTSLAQVVVRGNDCQNGNPSLHDTDGDGTSDCGVPIDDAHWSDADLDGYSTAEGDCDDTDSSVTPLAPELANGIDDDCDQLVDEGKTDLDGDGYVDDDCDDLNFWSNPSEPEVCDGVDNDCDGDIDDNCYSPELPECSGE